MSFQAFIGKNNAAAQSVPCKILTIRCSLEAYLINEKKNVLSLMKSVPKSKKIKSND